MSTLVINKKSLKTWLHTDSILDSFIISKFYFNADGVNFQIVEQGQSKRVIYAVSDITIIDDTDGGAEYGPYGTITELSLQLETLKYPAFYVDGSFNSITGLIEAGTNVTITGSGTESSPYIISSSGGGATPDLQAVVTEGGVVISTDGLKKVEIDKDNGQIKISTRPTTGDAWVVRSIIQDNAFAVSNVDGTLQSQLLYDMLTFQNPNTSSNTEYRYDRISNALDDFNNVDSLLPTATDTIFTPQKLALKPILNSEDFTAELGVDYETDQDLTVTDPADQVGSYRVFVANNNVTIGSVAYPKGSRIYRYYDGTAWDTIVLATTDYIPTLDTTPTNGSTNGVQSDGVFDALALKSDVNRSETFIFSKANGTFGSHTGNTTETVILTSTITGGVFQIGDWMNLMYDFSVTGTAGTKTIRFRAGTTGTTADALIGSAFFTAGVLDFGWSRERLQFKTGNILSGIANNYTAQGFDIVGNTAAKQSTSLNPSNNWILSVTVQLANSADTVSCDGYVISRVKSF